jgi:hypothetical protein
MERFDREFQVRGGQRGRPRRRTPSWVLTYAHTRHATSRVGDPVPHDRILVTNCCEMLAAKGGFKGGLDSAALRELFGGGHDGRPPARWGEGPVVGLRHPARRARGRGR